jgi:NTE family protein
LGEASRKPPPILKGRTLSTGPKPTTAPPCNPERGPDKYLPKDDRHGLALCLSGGGYRAALFHLGALRRLNEAGVLSRLDTISGVSGGSILAAFMAQRIDPWPTDGVIADFEERVEQPFRAFTKKNIRTLWILRRLLPWRWFDSTVAVQSLVKRYEADVVQLDLDAMPERPRFIFSATDMAFGVNWVSERTRVGSYQPGYMHPPPAWPAARAVAASSCFPPAFDPMPINLEPNNLKDGLYPEGPERDSLIGGLRLSDGGVYDNLGLEPVWKDHRTVLVSDGGATFDFKPDAGLFSRLFRYTGIQGRQATAARKRWLISNFSAGILHGTFWGIGSAVANYDQGAVGYDRDLVDRLISEVRTDLDCFSDAEAEVLINHGYLLTDVALRCHASQLIDQPAEAEVPFPELMDPAKVNVALADSAKRKLLGRWRWGTHPLPDYWG